MFWFLLGRKKGPITREISEIYSPKSDYSTDVKQLMPPLSPMHEVSCAPPIPKTHKIFGGLHP